MWVLTEDGELVNLEHASCIIVQPDGDRPAVVAYEAGWRELEAYGEDGRSIERIWHSQQHELCRCEDEEHARWVITELGGRIASLREFVDIKRIAQVDPPGLRRV